MAKGEYIIAGAGLAGSCVAIAMWEAGLPFKVVDDEVGDAASGVAAGLFNPITGSRFVKTWQAEQVFGILPAFYGTAEQLLGTHFFYPGPIARPFGSIAEQNLAVARTADPGYEHYMATTDLPKEVIDTVRAPFGGVVFDHGGWADVPVFIAAMKAWLVATGRYKAGQVQDVEETEGGILWQGEEFAGVVYCTGYRAAQQAMFARCGFSPVRGEILTLQLTQPWHGVSISKGVYLVGHQGHDQVRLGATYDWRNPEPTPSEAGRQELEGQCQEVLIGAYKVVGHQAGVRPAVKDRRPLAGKVPGSRHCYMLNGLGSKGVSLAPWLAGHLVQHIMVDQPMPVGVAPERFMLGK